MAIELYKVKRVLCHPMAWMAVTIALCLNIKENFPFSNFPMYSQQKDQTDYYFLKDSSGKAMATMEATRLSTTKIKKMMGKELSRIASLRKIDRGKLPLDAHEEAGREVLERIRKMGLFAPESGKKNRMESPVTLVWVNVQLGDAGIEKITRELTQG